MAELGQGGQDCLKTVTFIFDKTTEVLNSQSVWFSADQARQHSSRARKEHHLVAIGKGVSFLCRVVDSHRLSMFQWIPSYQRINGQASTSSHPASIFLPGCWDAGLSAHAESALIHHHISPALDSI